MQPVNIFWFRRDLRIEDNAGLFHALRSDKPVVPIFIFDTEILDKLEDRSDPRVSFIHSAINNIQLQLKKVNSTLEVYYGQPAEVFGKLLSRYTIGTHFLIYSNPGSNFLVCNAGLKMRK